MKKSKKLILPIVIFLFVLFCFYFYKNNEASASDLKNSPELKQRRNVFLTEQKRTRDNERLINILIVPGHDDKNYGTEFEGVKEVELNRQLAKNLQRYLAKEPGFNVVLASDEKGYNTLFERYFDREEIKIKKFIKDSKKDFKKQIADEDPNMGNNVSHNKAPEKVAYRLHGINHWADKQNFDLVIHIHFNDYGGRHSDKNFKYDGFSIYVPDESFKNYSLSFDFAKNIFDRLEDIYYVSNLEQEQKGIIPDHELIALGPNNSLKAGAVLVEYGYIYEKQFTDRETRDIILEEMAKQTYFGIKDFFGEKVYESNSFVFTKDLSQRKYIRTKDNFMLQKKLKELDYYPPKNKTERDCPIGGLFGNCTREAVINFQKDKKIEPTGYVGEVTRNILNSI